MTEETTVTKNEIWYTCKVTYTVFEEKREVYLITDTDNDKITIKEAVKNLLNNADVSEYRRYNNYESAYQDITKTKGDVISKTIRDIINISYYYPKGYNFYKWTLDSKLPKYADWTFYKSGDIWFIIENAMHTSKDQHISYCDDLFKSYENDLKLKIPATLNEIKLFATDVNYYFARFSYKEIHKFDASATDVKYFWRFKDKPPIIKQEKQTESVATEEPVEIKVTEKDISTTSECWFSCNVKYSVFGETKEMWLIIDTDNNKIDILTTLRKLLNNVGISRIHFTSSLNSQHDKLKKENDLVDGPHDISCLEQNKGYYFWELNSKVPNGRWAWCTLGDVCFVIDCGLISTHEEQIKFCNELYAKHKNNLNVDGVFCVKETKLLDNWVDKYFKVNLFQEIQDFNKDSKYKRYIWRLCAEPQTICSSSKNNQTAALPQNTEAPTEEVEEKADQTVPTSPIITETVSPIITETVEKIEATIKENEDCGWKLFILTYLDHIDKNKTYKLHIITKHSISRVSQKFPNCNVQNVSLLGSYCLIDAIHYNNGFSQINKKPNDYYSAKYLQKSFITPGETNAGYIIWKDEEIPNAGYALCYVGPYNFLIGTTGDLGRCKEILNQSIPTNVVISEYDKFITNLQRSEISLVLSLTNKKCTSFKPINEFAADGNESILYEYCLDINNVDRDDIESSWFNFTDNDVLDNCFDCHKFGIITKAKFIIHGNVCAAVFKKDGKTLSNKCYNLIKTGSNDWIGLCLDCMLVHFGVSVSNKLLNSPSINKYVQEYIEYNLTSGAFNQNKLELEINGFKFGLISNEEVVKFKGFEKVIENLSSVIEEKITALNSLNEQFLEKDKIVLELKSHLELMLVEKNNELVAKEKLLLEKTNELQKETETRTKLSASYEKVTKELDTTKKACTEVATKEKQLSTELQKLKELPGGLQCLKCNKFAPHNQSNMENGPMSAEGADKFPAPTHFPNFIFLELQQISA